MILTIACPSGLIGDGNALFATIGAGAANLATFRGSNWTDGRANHYAAMNFETERDRWDKAQSALGRPIWDSTIEHTTRTSTLRDTVCIL
jgi:hypothetical protein